MSLFPPCGYSSRAGGRSSLGLKNNKQTAASIRNRKETLGAKKIVAVTAYDYTFAKLFDPHVDILLVGDSLGMVVQGNSNTLSVTMDEMIYHSKAVSKGSHLAHLVADMPFMSYQTGERDALIHAGRLMAEGNAEAVKVEGGVRVAPIVKKMVEIGIPVMGHVGLTPQSVHAFGGFKVQGKSQESRKRIMEDVNALEFSGAYAIVLEGIPIDLAKEITASVSIPTIGIGAGVNCDGQVLVSQDLLGMNQDFKPKFVKHYVDMGAHIERALKSFSSDVEDGSFPSSEHSFH